MRSRTVRISLSTEQAKDYDQATSGMPVIREDEILRLGLDRLLGLPLSTLSFVSSSREQLENERTRMIELQKRLAEKKRELEQLSEMLHRYKADMATLEQVLPILEGQVRQLRKVLGMKLPPPRFVTEDQ